MSTELNSDPEMPPQDESLTMDFPLEQTHQHETHVLKLATPPIQASMEKVVETHILKPLSESSRKRQLQQGETTLDEDKSLNNDEEDLEDSNTITKQRCNAENAESIRREETRKQLELDGWLSGLRFRVTVPGKRSSMTNKAA